MMQRREPRWVLSLVDHPLPSPSLPGFWGEASPRKQIPLLITKNAHVVCVGFCSGGVEVLFWMEV